MGAGKRDGRGDGKVENMKVKLWPPSSDFWLFALIILAWADGILQPDIDGIKVIIMALIYWRLKPKAP